MTRTSGMSCAHCVRSVRDALADLSGVTVEDVAVGSTTLEHDPTVATVVRVAEVIGEAGYRAAPAA